MAYKIEHFRQVSIQNSVEMSTVKKQIKLSVIVATISQQKHIFDDKCDNIYGIIKWRKVNLKY